MNTIDQIFGSNQTVATNSKSNELGQEDFLKLLVAQLKNQDPSNPVENGEFLGQIAQFSMVSGIDDLGSSFDGIASSLFATQAMQASQLVGKEVLVDSDVTGFTTGGTVEAVIGLNQPAANAKLKIHDVNGGLVQSIDLGNLAAGTNTIKWNGLDQEGNSAPSGNYVLVAEGLIDGQLQGLPLQVYSKVKSISVDRNNTSVSVALEGNGRVGLSQISEFK